MKLAAPKPLSRITSLTRQQGKRRSAAYRQQIVAAYIFLLPALALFLIFLVYPLVKAFQISFYDWNIMPGKVSQFVGLENYIRVFSDNIASLAFKNTLLYTMITVPAQMVLAMLAALLLNSLSRGRVILRVIYYLPVITSWVIVSLLFRYLFQSPNGMINYMLVNLAHLFSKPIGWFQSASTAMIPIWLLGTWKGIGWSMVIFLAGLQTIPTELYEAAAIDGASGWQKFRHVTIPLLRPTVVFTLVMLLIGGLNVFLPVALVTNGGPMQQTEVVLTYMYHQAFDYLDFGYGAALAFLMAIFIVTLSYLQIRFLRKPEEIR